MSEVEFRRLPEMLEPDVLEAWLLRIAQEHNRKVKHLVYTFVDDTEILDINKRFLAHDYYTDIITFEYSTGHGAIKGEVYVSLDTVRSNANKLGNRYEEELLRVIAHGLLHLLGFGDKSPEEQDIMRREEDFCLLLRPEKLMKLRFT